MPSYKLTYFDGRGLAEVCRLLFTLADQPFEDIRITQEEWPNVKPTTPFGQVPVLEVDGKAYAESTAIANHLAREFGYYGKNNLESLEIDQVVGLVEDFLNSFKRTVHEQDEEKKAECAKNFKEVDGPKYVSFFETLLKQNGTGYFVGDSLTLADIMVYNMVYNMSKRHASLTDNAPEFKALSEKLESNDKIKAYLATRKQTEF